MRHEGWKPVPRDLKEGTETLSVTIVPLSSYRRIEPPVTYTRHQTKTVMSLDIGTLYMKNVWSQKIIYFTYTTCITYDPCTYYYLLQHVRITLLDFSS